MLTNWLNFLVKNATSFPQPLVLLLCLTLPLSSRSQSVLTLEDCYAWAYEQNPQRQRLPLIEATTSLHLENIRQSRLPSVGWGAVGQVQSENIALNFPFPGVEGVDLPLYNFKTFLEGNYLLLDGGLHKAQEEAEHARMQVELQAVAVALYPVRDQVNARFFAILLLQKRAALLASVKQDLEYRRQSVEAAVRHGIALESDLKKLEVELIKLNAQRVEVQGNIDAEAQVLGALIGRPVAPDTRLEAPELADFSFSDKINRPEIQWFEHQKAWARSQEALIDAQRRPKVSLFAQTGLGYPNPLNFFDETLSPYGIVGASFRWNFLDWGKADRDRDLLGLQLRQIETQQASFEHQVQTLEGKFLAQQAALEKLISQYQTISDLQKEISVQYAAQLEQGVLTMTDYLLQVNEELKARLQLQLYQVQWQQLKVAYLTHKGLF